MELTAYKVVLLDDADVFLEERTFFDLQRNALVSGTSHVTCMFELNTHRSHSFSTSTGVL